MIIEELNGKKEILVNSNIEKIPLYFSPRLREALLSIDNDVARALLVLEGNEKYLSDVSFLDYSESGYFSYISSKVAIKKLKERYPNIEHTDTIKNNINYIYESDESGSGPGVFKSFDENGKKIPRNRIKIVKFLSKYFTVGKESEIFLNEINSAFAEGEIEVVSGDSIPHWYNSDNYFPGCGTLNSSCMRYSEPDVFDIYKNNPDSCKLVILRMGNKISARALLWKLHSIKHKDLKKCNKPEYFLDRIYYDREHNGLKLKKYAEKMGWAIRKHDNYSQKKSITYNGETLICVNMTVKIDNKQTYHKYPYLDTFSRYNFIRGLLYNDDDDNKLGYILNSTMGKFKKNENSKINIFWNKLINKFSNINI